MFNKIKSLLKDDSVFYGGLIILVGIASFGLGKYSVHETTPKEQRAAVVMTKSAENQIESSSATTKTYVASKNGSKYHLPWCAGAQQMNEENKIWFQTKEEAEKAGYAPAANCKGL
ncbi:MAG: hypothetical protein ACI9VM_000906 [Candidatus Azotimanducaceae bacterium]|jgi:hypothetical protein